MAREAGRTREKLAEGFGLLALLVKSEGEHTRELFGAVERDRLRDRAACFPSAGSTVVSRG